MKQYKIIAGIPAYNEEKYIRKIVKLTKQYVNTVIVIDDGSTDKTYKEARIAGAIVIRHPRNMGYGAALRTIFNTSRRLEADILVTLDGDGQHNPSEIPILLDPLVKRSADMVIGSRFLGYTDQPNWRLGGVKIITWIAKLGLGLPKHITDVQNGFRAYNKKAISLIRPSDFDMGASIEIIYQAITNNLKIVEVPTTVIHHRDANTQNPLIHGIKIVNRVARITLKHKIIN